MARFPRGFGSKPPLGIHWDNSLSDKLLSAILLNEGGGLNVIDSVWGLQGLLQGSTGQPTWDKSGNSIGGRGGEGLSFVEANTQTVQFDGTRYLNIQNAQFTVMGWLRLNASQDTDEYVISKTDANVAGGWIVTANSSGTVNGAVKFQLVLASSNHANPGVTAPFGRLFQFACTWDFGTKTSQVYIDGVNGSTATNGAGSGTESGNHPLTIGNGNFGGSHPFGGFAERFYIWTRILNPSEIQALYVNPNAMHQPARRYVPGTGVNPPSTLDGSGHSILSAEAFGAPGTIGHPGDQFLIGTGDSILSGEAFGAGGALSLGNQLIGGAGIASAEAFGGGQIALANQIVGSYGIPSAEAFGAGALLLQGTTRSFTLFISGVDVTAHVRESTMDIINSISQVSTASFAYGGQDLTSPLLSLVVGQQVAIYDGNLRIFGGTIDSVTNSFTGKDSTQGPNVMQVTCSDFSEILDRRYVAASYPSLAGATVFDLVAIVTDLVGTYLAQDGITYNTIDGNNATVLSPNDLTFDWITARQAFTQLANLVEFDFSVDYYGVLRFYPNTAGSGAAPFNIGDNDGNWLSDPPMTVQEYRGTYRNKQGVRSSSQSTALWIDTYSAADPGPYPNSPQPPDGIRQLFITLYGIPTTPYVFVNGSAQRVIDITQIGAAGPDGYDWYWIPPQGFSPSKVVNQNPAHAPLTAGQTLQIQYQAPVSPILFVVCQDEINARKAIEGNSGIYEDVQDVPNITDPSALQAYAQGLLNRYGCLYGMPKQVIYATDKHGLFAGMTQTIHTTNPLNPGVAPYQLSQVEIKDLDGKRLRYTVTADSGLFQGNSATYLGALITRGQLAQPANRMFYTWQLAPSYPGITNPGLSSGDLQTQVTVHSSEVPLFFVIYCGTPPGVAGRNVEFLINGAGTQQLQIPTVNGPTTSYFALAQPLPLGSTLIPLFQGGNSGIKDGVLTLVTAVIRN